MNRVEQNQGEVKLRIDTPLSGNISLSDLGWQGGQVFEDGRIRLVLEMDEIQEPSFYNRPTFEFVYEDKMEESHWQVDFNEETILDKLDQQGHKTLFFLNKDQLESKWQHHHNRLILHAEFPASVKLLPEASHVNLFK